MPTVQENTFIKYKENIRIDLYLVIGAGVSECVLSHVQLSVTPWNVAHRVPLSMEFPREEYWNGLPFPSPERCGYTVVLICQTLTSTFQKQNIE